VLEKVEQGPHLVSKLPVGMPGNVALHAFLELVGQGDPLLWGPLRLGHALGLHREGISPKSHSLGDAADLSWPRCFEVVERLLLRAASGQAFGVGQRTEQHDAAFTGLARGQRSKGLEVHPGGYTVSQRECQIL
jgi:hypothetical protein